MKLQGSGKKRIVKGKFNDNYRFKYDKDTNASWKESVNEFVPAKKNHFDGNKKADREKKRKLRSYGCTCIGAYILPTCPYPHLGVQR